MPTVTRLGAVSLLAAVSVLGFTYLLLVDDSELQVPNGRRLSAAPREVKWDAKNISGVVLSVLVSLASSIDRECGVSLYMVLFAVLLNQPFRLAITLTTFTVACGSLAPGIAAMSEPHMTERGVLALADYPGALILLPTMFYGLSWGIIVNYWFPNWLLALLWVLFMAMNNLELIYSLFKIRRLRKQGHDTLEQLLALDAALPPAVDSKQVEQHAAIEMASSMKDTGMQQVALASVTAGKQDTSDTAISVDDVTSKNVADVGGPAAAAQQLHARLRDICSQAEDIESIALLYPAFHLATLQDVVDRYTQYNTATGSVDSDSSRRATASTVRLLADDEQQMRKELNQQLWAGTRFTLRWHAWWKLQNHFEFALLLKVVVLHLITEALRHKLSKPCTTRYWIMLGGVTSAVTLFLIFTVTSYSSRRLWRGPHWTNALETVRRKKQSERSQPGSATAPSADANITVRSDQHTVTAAVGDATNMQPEAASGAAEAATEDTQQRRCCSNFGKKLPWKWVPAVEALTNVSACNSNNNYNSWTLPRLLSAAAATQVIGILGCALGQPAGPAMAVLLLRFGLKPHVVAGTSRFLVLCFFFGCFVAYAITGTYQKKLALAYGLLNLGLAPLGMLIFNRLRIRSQHLLLVSLLMGVIGMITVLIYQLVPLLAHAADVGHKLPRQLQYGPVTASLVELGNDFDIGRFCAAGTNCKNFA